MENDAKPPPPAVGSRPPAPCLTVLSLNQSCFSIVQFALPCSHLLTKKSWRKVTFRSLLCRFLARFAYNRRFRGFRHPRNPFEVHNDHPHEVSSRDGLFVVSRIIGFRRPQRQFYVHSDMHTVVSRIIGFRGFRFPKKAILATQRSSSRKAYQISNVKSKCQIQMSK